MILIRHVIFWHFSDLSSLSRPPQLYNVWTTRRRASTTPPVWPSTMAWTDTAGKSRHVSYAVATTRNQAHKEVLTRGLLDVKATSEIGFLDQPRPVHGTMRFLLRHGRGNKWLLCLDKVHQYWEQYQYTHFHLPRCYLGHSGGFVAQSLAAIKLIAVSTPIYSTVDLLLLGGCQEEDGTFLLLEKVNRPP